MASLHLRISPRCGKKARLVASSSLEALQPKVSLWHVKSASAKPSDEGQTVPIAMRILLKLSQNSSYMIFSMCYLLDIAPYRTILFWLFWHSWSELGSIAAVENGNNAMLGGLCVRVSKYSPYQAVMQVRHGLQPTITVRVLVFSCYQSSWFLQYHIQSIRDIITQAFYLTNSPSLLHPGEGAFTGYKGNCYIFHYSQLLLLHAPIKSQSNFFFSQDLCEGMLARLILLVLKHISHYKISTDRQHYKIRTDSNF